MKKAVKTAICGVLLAVLAITSVAAEIPYSTYTYQNGRKMMKTPHAYTPSQVFEADAFDGTPLSNPGDVFVDAAGRVYLSDSGNNRVLRLNPDCTLDRVFDSFEKDGERQTFSSPDGLCVTESGDVYVADTGNARVVAIDKDGRFLRELVRPETDLLDDTVTFKPIAVSVDRFSRVFVVDMQASQGIFAFDKDSRFTGFIGSQKVAYNPLEYFWKGFLTKDQTDRMQTFIPTVYSNVTCAQEGFIYGVSASVNEKDLEATIQNRLKDGRTTPVKKLNEKGFDILKRNGAYPPVGDLFYDYDSTGKAQLSTIVDIALGEAGTYTLLDSRRGRLFTYTKHGDLLFAFGEKTTQAGNNVNPVAVEYKGSDLLVLDAQQASLTVYARSTYGGMLLNAQTQFNAYQYDQSAEQWEQILDLNPNCALAYDGMGRSLLNAGNYAEAMQCFKRADNIEQYSEAFKGCRDSLLKVWLGPVVVGVVLLLFALVKLSGYLNNCNRAKYRNARHPLWYAFTYAFYIMFHPFDGFWDLRHEKRGDVRIAHLFFGLFFVVEVLRAIMTAPIAAGAFRRMTDVFGIFMQTFGIAVLFIVANWCLTSLMDGKGSLPAIYTAVGYAMLPMILLRAVTIPLSYFVTAGETMYITFLVTLSLIWSLLLAFSGVMVTQQYSLAKNTVTTGLSVVGMGIIVFILLLFLTTFNKIGGFAHILFTEFTR